MPSCKRCGSYTKYFNGLCTVCYSGGKSKAGKVYIGEVLFGNGKSTIYTGQTKRKVYARVKEHMSYQRNGNNAHYTGKGVGFRLIGSLFSKNRFKAEKTIKKLPRRSKISLGREGARRFREKFY